MKSNKKEKLGVLIPGMGAVASTFICGVIACNKGLAKPIGSMSQMGSIRLGKRTEDRSPIIKDFAPLADLDNLVFGGWDIADENVYEISIRSEVLDKNLLNDLKSDLESINVYKAVFDERFVKMWEFYMASCAAAFRYKDLVVFQLQIVKNFQSSHRTRDYIYS